MLEIGTEEMPAKAVDLGIDELKNNAAILLKDNRITFSDAETYGTPRRLALIVKDLAERQEDAVREVKGPAKKAAFDDAGRPTPAAIGFAGSQQVEVKNLEVRDIGGEYVFAVKNLPGQPVNKIMPALLPELIYSLQFPKSMRWGEGEMRFVRPIRWLVAILDGEPVDFEVDGLKSGRRSYGHRFLSPGQIEIKKIDDYFGLLEKAKVMVDQVRRRETIISQVEKASENAGGKADMDLNVLDEVVNLVEYPHTSAGTFAHEFLTIPKAVVKMAMESHQRYFPVEKDGRLLPAFIVVQNGSADFSAHVTKGHERVLRARLADAAFFFMEDTRRPLADKVDQLKGVIYQKKLGSVFDKIERVGELCRWAADRLQFTSADKEYLLRAAYLCKADLVTGMVGEFPELQGIIGKEYALVDREPGEVAEAIAEHYLPRFAGDELPETIIGALLAVADKIDSVAGCFSVGLIPTGSQDPYALRRQAQGTVAILAKFKLDLAVTDFLNKSLEIYEAAGIKAEAKNRAELENFWQVRLIKHFASQNYGADQIEAVLSAGYRQLEDIGVRLRSLAKYKDEPDMEIAKIAYTRCINLSQTALGMKVDEALLNTDEEKLLWRELSNSIRQAERAVAAGKFDDLPAILAELRSPIDLFFDAVLVMDPDEKLRENRLRLLNNCVRLAFLLADFSKLS